MTWSKLPRGEFTGIDWALPNATDGFDPYLIWAETDSFAGYGDTQPKWLPIAIEDNGAAHAAPFHYQGQVTE